MTVQNLPEYLEAAARRFPDRTAVVDPTGATLTYAELDGQSSALAGFLAGRGVKTGDRVGMVIPKSARSVVSLFGIMKAGAAYVPVDSTAPAERARRILTDCRISALIVDARMLGALPDDPEVRPAAVLTVGDVDVGAPLPASALSFDEAVGGNAPAPDARPGLGDLAYVLYTSGSTGMPKGVMLTHENAVSFVDWCSSEFAPTEHDRFSSHAPFHFDLSVLDIYVSIKHGATLYLISEDLGKNPKELARFIEANQLTIWYSTPSILTLLVQFGGLEQHRAVSLRYVFFAGEVFPVKHLREVKRRWPGPQYFNLYGPTETNVCTFARIPATIPEDRDTPYPIGFPCSHCQSLVLDQDGQEVSTGGEGLLYIAGPSVFQGYWNRPVENAAAFQIREGVRWYNTGDVVRWAPDDGFVYLGRRDRMVKRRGYRIELGEIERALYGHPRIREAAVVATPDADAGVRITAFLACHDGAPPSIVALKTYCGSALPGYMSPDRFVTLDALPKTSTDKTDYQALKARLQAG